MKTKLLAAGIAALFAAPAMAQSSVTIYGIAAVSYTHLTLPTIYSV